MSIGKLVERIAIAERKLAEVQEAYERLVVETTKNQERDGEIICRLQRELEEINGRFTKLEQVRE